MKFKCINGFTKEKMIDVVNNEFKGKSFVGSSGCRYKTYDGRKCAVGMFIPDSKYDEGMDNRSHFGNSVSITYLLHYFPNVEVDMPLDHDGLVSFQSCHDGLNLMLSIDKQKEVLLDWINKYVE